MNATVRENKLFQINPVLVPEKLAEQFQARRSVHVTNFLPYAVATALSRHLVDCMAYQTYVVANEDEMATSPGEESILTPDDEREMLDVACEGARNGFASYFEANGRLRVPDPAEESSVITPFNDFVQFLNSSAFLDFARKVTGLDKIQRVDAHATRFRGGHFVLFNNGTFSADVSGKRRVNFELNLTQQWRPEWGGMLEMRGDEGYQIEAVMPCFNCLDLFAFPKGYWISQVTPFAHASRYAIFGSLFVE